MLNPVGEEPGALLAVEHEVITLAGGGEHALSIGDDSERDGARERKGRAHRQHVIADHELIGVTERSGREWLGRVLELRCIDLEHGEIGPRVFADERGGDALLVGEHAPELVALIGDVCVGEHVSIGGDNRA